MPADGKSLRNRHLVPRAFVLIASRLIVKRASASKGEKRAAAAKRAGVRAIAEWSVVGASERRSSTEKQYLKKAAAVLAIGACLVQAVQSIVQIAAELQRGPECPSLPMPSKR
jgi:hypothetical protein